MSDLLLDLGLEFVRSPPELVHVLADLAGDLRQFLWPENDEGQKEQEDRLGKTHAVHHTAGEGKAAMLARRSDDKLSWTNDGCLSCGNSYVDGGFVNDLLTDAAKRASQYVEQIRERRVAPLAEDVSRLESLAGPLPEASCDPREVLAMLDDFGSPATVATTGGRFFGFVIGGVLPAALAANWLAGAWDQNAAMQVMSPVAARLEEIVQGWILDMLGVPATSGVGFVTGTTMANFSGLAAARSAILQKSGWNLEEDGFFGAPPIRVVVGQEVHVSVLRALTMLGLGRSRVTTVPVDGQGRMRADSLPRLDEKLLSAFRPGM